MEGKAEVLGQPPPTLAERGIKKEWFYCCCLAVTHSKCMLHSPGERPTVTSLVNVAMLIVKKRTQAPPGIFICERWKSTNQAAIRGLKPHEIFSLNASRCRTLSYEVCWYLQHLPHGHLVRCFCRSTVHGNV